MRLLLHRGRKGKACGDDRVGARFCKPAQRLFTLSFGLQFDFAELAAGFFGPALAPLKAASLKDLSNLPPKSKIRAGSARAAPALQREGGGCTEEFVHKAHGCVSQMLLFIRGVRPPSPGLQDRSCAHAAMHPIRIVINRYKAGLNKPEGQPILGKFPGPVAGSLPRKTVQSGGPKRGSRMNASCRVASGDR